MRNLNRIIFLFVLVNFNCVLNAKNNVTNIFVNKLTTLKDVRFVCDLIPILTGFKQLHILINTTIPKTGMMGVKMILIKL
jgi:hypothetical protein